MVGPTHHVLGIGKNMKDKEMCVVDIKPKTDVGIFWLKEPDGLELDLRPTIKERKPLIKGILPKQRRNYIGRQYKSSK